MAALLLARSDVRGTHAEGGLAWGKVAAPQAVEIGME